MTTPLWINIIIMIALAGLFVLVPVIRFRAQNDGLVAAERKQTNIDLFKQRQAELAQELEDDKIEQADFESMNIELERSFLSDMDVTKSQTKQSKHNKLFPLVCLLLMPIASFLIYEIVGSGNDLAIPLSLDKIANAQSQEEQSEALEELAVALDDRYQRHTDDIQNGYMLGTLHLELRRYSEAKAVFTQLAAGMEDNPDKATVLGQLAQASYMEAGSTMTPQTQGVIDQALALNPNEFAVMSLLAIEAVVNEDFNTAVTYWRRQLLQAQPGSNQAAVIIDRISQVEQLLGSELAPDPALSSVAITVHVEIDESIRDLIAADMRLFIFARGESVPLPLAAQTFDLSELPLTITLDDSMAMTPQFKLSTADRVYVGARISRVATAQPGDFQAISATFSVSEQTETINLTIKDIVQ